MGLFVIVGGRGWGVLDKWGGQKTYIPAIDVLELVGHLSCIRNPLSSTEGDLPLISLCMYMVPHLRPGQSWKFLY